MAYIYLAYWNWNENVTGLGPAWQAPFPNQVRAIVDLRSNNLASSKGADYGLGIFVYDEPQNVDGVLLGSNPLSLVNLQTRNDIKNLLGLGENIIAATSGGIIWELLTSQADAQGIERVCPLMPTHSGNLDLHLGPFRRIRSRRFSILESPQSFIRMKNQYIDIREKVLNGDYSPKLHVKFLTNLSRKINIPYERLIPDGYPYEPPEEPTTTISDDFNRADDDTFNGSIAAAGWTWTELSGTLFEIISNELAMNDSSGGTNMHVRANYDLSTDDHYATLTGRTMNSSNASDQNFGIINRKDSTTTLTFYAHEYSTKTSGQYWRTYKCVSSSYTVFDAYNSSVTPVSGDIIKGQADGSTITRYRNGSLQAEITDSAVSGYLRTGLNGHRSGSTTSLVSADDFYASDIPSATDIYIAIMGRPGGGYGVRLM